MAFAWWRFAISIRTAKVCPRFESRITSGDPCASRAKMALLKFLPRRNFLIEQVGWQTKIPKIPMDKNNVRENGRTATRHS